MKIWKKLQMERQKNDHLSTFEAFGDPGYKKSFFFHAHDAASPGMPQEMLDFINAAQAAVDSWIKEGGLRE